MFSKANTALYALRFPRTYPPNRASCTCFPAAPRATAARRTPTRRCRNARQGTAVVELAATLPLVVYVTLAGMQASQMINLRHTGLFIVDEVARAALDSAATDAKLIKLGGDLAADAGLRRVDFRVRRRTSAAIVEVEAGIPVSDNYNGPTVFPSRVLNVVRSVYLDAS